MANGQYIGVNGVARKVVSPYIGVNAVARKVETGYVGVNGVARLFFTPDGGDIVLEVKKVISDTYANNTAYTAEEFILLYIYPKAGGTVNVTYGGLTKTITDTSGAENPNAQTVFFGTFNGVSDSVATPSSGELVIEGDYDSFGQAAWQKNKSDIAFFAPQPCITQIKNLGSISFIPMYAFQGCTGLTSVAIPSSVTRIDDGAFGGCTGLTNIVVDNSNAYYSSDGLVLFNKDKTLLHSYPAGYGDYIIPSSVTSIGGYAFDGCTGLTSVTIPSSVTSIGSYAFRGCTGLTSVAIPSSVTSIGSYAFDGCTGLTSVTIQNGVMSIERGAFRGCTNLTNVAIPSSVTSIGNWAFYECTGLTSVTFANISGWYVTKTEGATSGTSIDVTDATYNADLLTDAYCEYYWYRS